MISYAKVVSLVTTSNKNLKSSFFWKKNKESHILFYDFGIKKTKIIVKKNRGKERDSAH